AAGPLRRDRRRLAAEGGDAVELAQAPALARADGLRRGRRTLPAGGAARAPGAGRGARPARLGGRGDAPLRRRVAIRGERPGGPGRARARARPRRLLAAPEGRPPRARRVARARSPPPRPPPPPR